MNNTRKAQKRTAIDKYQKTYLGLSSVMYHSTVVQRSRKKWNIDPDFSIGVFREWLEKNEYNKYYDGWVVSGYLKMKKPSIDRIDCLGKYTLENMQLMTYGENLAKAGQEKTEHLGKKITQMTLDGEFIATYPSLNIASQKTGIRISVISRAWLRKNKNICRGYKWERI